MTTRRSLITGLVSFLATPAIVRAGSLMPVKVFEPLTDLNEETLLIVINKFRNVGLRLTQNFVLENLYSRSEHAEGLLDCQSRRL